MDRKKEVQEATAKLWTFLEPYLPLANAHNTDFITHQHWDIMLPQNIAAQLLQLDKSELIKLPNGELLSFAHKRSAADEEGPVDPDSLKLLPDNSDCCSLRSQTQMLPQVNMMMNSKICKEEEYTSVPNTTEMEQIGHCKKGTKGTRQKWDHSQKPRWMHSDLESFIRDASRHTLPQLGIESSVESALQDFKTGILDVVEIDSHMSAKKCHEVHIMSKICAAICKAHGISDVIDIGSGKGYLATELAFQHQLKVLGIDSSHVNTSSANNRKSKLGKYWTGLYRKATGKEKGESESELVLNRSAEINTTTDPHLVNVENVEKASDYNLDSHHIDASSCSKTMTQKFRNVTMYVTKDLDLMQVHKDVFKDGDETLDDGVNKFAITGLHTCGNLGSSLLQIFAHNPHAELLFSVGCCYHLIEEEFVKNPFQADEGNDADLEFGFPLSQYLKMRECKLGRNARMLACQAAERMVTHQQMPDESLFYRAVLQVILQHITGETRNDWQVGKIAKKCKGFLDYTKRALKKLNIESPLQDAEIDSFYTKHQMEKQKLDAYFQFRAVLAPCVEALILLDRMLFLQEQKDTKQCFLVKLFDAVASPRCYCIISNKATE